MSTEQKRHYTVKWFTASKGDEPYALLVQKSDGLAVECSCGSRVERGRKSGTACKHMISHNKESVDAKQAIETPVAVAKCESSIRISRQVASMYTATPPVVRATVGARRRSEAPFANRAFSFMR